MLDIGKESDVLAVISLFTDLQIAWSMIPSPLLLLILFFVLGLQSIFQQGLHYLVQTEEIHTNLHHRPDLTH